MPEKIIEDVIKTIVIELDYLSHDLTLITPYQTMRKAQLLSRFNELTTAKYKLMSIIERS